MIIGIDIDDTITDTYEVLFNYAQEYTLNALKKEPKIKDVNSCKTHFYTSELHGWNKEEEEKFFELYYKKTIENVRPKTLSCEYLEKLSKENNKIVLITARSKPDYLLNVEYLTKSWLSKNNICYNKLIIDAIDKKEVAKKEKIDIFIDDSFENCQEVSSCGIKTYIMDTRVNKGLEDNNITRVYSWPHLYKEIKSN